MGQSAATEVIRTILILNQITVTTISIRALHMGVKVALAEVASWTTVVRTIKAALPKSVVNLRRLFLWINWLNVKQQGFGKDTLRPVTIKQLVDAQLPHPDADFRIDNNEITQVGFLLASQRVAPALIPNYRSPSSVKYATYHNKRQTTHTNSMTGLERSR